MAIEVAQPNHWFDVPTVARHLTLLLPVVKHGP